MKKTLLLSVFYLFIVQASFGQDCDIRAANKPSTLVMFPNQFSNTVSSQNPGKWNITKMKPQQDKVESWVKNILTGFTGAKLAYSNEYSLDPLDFRNLPEDVLSGSYATQFYLATGIKGYYGCKMRFFAYYCNDNSNNVLTEDESGSFVHVNFNNVFASGICTDFGVITINGKPAFKIFEKDHSEGRIDFYQQRAIINGIDTYASRHDFIFIRNSDKPLFIPVSRKEYLEQMLKNVDAYKIKDITSAKEQYSPATEAANKANFDEELKRIDNSKNYTPEQMAPYRKRFIESWETEKQKYDKRIAQIEAESAKAKEVLLEYLKMPQDWLGQNFSNFYPYDTYSAKGLTDYFEKIDVFTESREELTRTEIVMLNPSYFNNKLSVDVPQLISVHLPKSNYPHMLKVAKLVKQPGALAPLEAILNQ